MNDKDDKVKLQESKEFQMKVMWLNLDEEAIVSPCVVDQQIFNLVKKAISSAVKELAEGKPTKLVFNDKVWRREGIRYDTENSTLKSKNLTLAIEATNECTKLKCKEHNFIPELLYEKADESICYPDIQASKGYKKHKTKFKLEEDLHFSNLKYCASGSLFVEGRSTQVKTLEFFSRYFPALITKIPLPADTPLNALSHWDEAVFDEMSVEWDGVEFKDWMLVNRWEWGTNKLIESELSFKVEKEMDKDWEYDDLRKANQLYLALQKKSLFIQVPPIFFYNKPVSSVDICVCPK